VKYLLSRRCVFKGEHCEAYVKKFEYLFGSNRSGQVPANGGINWTVDNSWHLFYVVQLIKLWYRKIVTDSWFGKSIFILIVYVDSKDSRKLDIFSWTMTKYWTTSLLCSRYVSCHKALHDDSNSDCEGDLPCFMSRKLKYRLMWQKSARTSSVSTLSDQEPGS